MYPSGPPPAGVISPQPRLADGRRLDDAIGYRFAVVGEPGVLAALSPAVRAHLRALDAVVVEAGGAVTAWLAGEGMQAAVLQPDRYVFGRAPEGEALNVLVEALAGSLGIAGAPPARAA